jgi:hypothetical protein
MQAADDVDRHPLGAPIRPEKAEPVEEWRALDPSKPWIQTNSVTGKMRNVRPTPADAPLPWPNFQP